MINIEREIKFHQNLNHPNIIKFYDYIKKDDEMKVYILLEYAENGDLFNFLNKRGALDERTACKYFVQTSLALNYIHSWKMIHRDVKPENILLDGQLNAKVCDFGWSAEYDENTRRQTVCGTYEYMAPEILFKKQQDTGIDIWACGILLFELLHNRAPYSGRSLVEVSKRIAAKNIEFDRSCPIDAKELILSILKTNPKERPTVKEYLNHPFVLRCYGKIDESLYIFPDRKEPQRSSASSSGPGIIRSLENTAIIKTQGCQPYIPQSYRPMQQSVQQLPPNTNVQHTSVNGIMQKKPVTPSHQQVHITTGAMVPSQNMSFQGVMMTQTHAQLPPQSVHLTPQQIVHPMTPQQPPIHTTHILHRANSMAPTMSSNSTAIGSTNSTSTATTQIGTPQPVHIPGPSTPQQPHIHFNFQQPLTPQNYPQQMQMQNPLQKTGLYQNQQAKQSSDNIHQFNQVKPIIITSKGITNNYETPQSHLILPVPVTPKSNTSGQPAYFQLIQPMVTQFTPSNHPQNLQLQQGASQLPPKPQSSAQQIQQTQSGQGSQQVDLTSVMNKYIRPAGTPNGPKGSFSFSPENPQAVFKFDDGSPVNHNLTKENVQPQPAQIVFGGSTSLGASPVHSNNGQQIQHQQGQSYSPHHAEHNVLQPLNHNNNLSPSTSPEDKNRQILNSTKLNSLRLRKVISDQPFPREKEQVAKSFTGNQNYVGMETNGSFAEGPSNVSVRVLTKQNSMDISTDPTTGKPRKYPLA